MISPLAACEDSMLIRMAIAGRSECFSVLMDRHLTAVKSKLRRMVADEAELDDLIQEVLLKAWRHLATFRSEASLRTWMIGIGINQARQSYRRSQRRPVCQPIDDFALTASSAESPHQQLLRVETAAAVYAEIAKLPPNYREVLVLRDLSELCCKETAERLQMTISGVKTRLLRARNMLSKRMRGSRVWSAAR